MMAIPAVIAEGEEGELEAKGKKVADLFQYIIFTLRRYTDCNHQRFLKEILRYKFSLTWGFAKFLSMASIVQILKMQLMLNQGVAQRCRLSWLTNSALVYEPKCGEGEVAGPKNKYSCAHVAQLNFGDLYVFNPWSDLSSSLLRRSPVLRDYRGNEIQWQI